jgi:hypothetical protein
MRLQQLAWIVLFLCFAAVFGVAVWSASQKSPPNNRQEQSAAKNQDSERGGPFTNPAAGKDAHKASQEGYWGKTFREHPAEWWLALFNGLLVGVTGWLVWATIGLRKSAEDVFYATDRPWVGSVTVANNAPKIGHPWDAWVIIRNTGRSPAREMRASVVGHMLPAGTVPTHPNVANIAPKALFAFIPDHHPADFGPVPISQVDSAALQDGSIVAW